MNASARSPARSCGEATTFARPKPGPKTRTRSIPASTNSARSIAAICGSVIPAGSTSGSMNVSETTLAPQPAIVWRSVGVTTMRPPGAAAVVTAGAGQRAGPGDGAGVRPGGAGVRPGTISPSTAPMTDVSPQPAAARAQAAR